MYDIYLNIDENKRIFIRKKRLVIPALFVFIDQEKTCTKYSNFCNFRLDTP